MLFSLQSRRILPISQIQVASGWFSPCSCSSVIFLKIALFKCSKVSSLEWDKISELFSCQPSSPHFIWLQPKFLWQCWYHQQEFMLWGHTGFPFLFWKYNALIKLMSLFESVWEFTCTGDAEYCDSFWISWSRWWSS